MANTVMISDADSLLREVDIHNSAVLVIDIQNDFCHEEGAFAKASKSRGVSFIQEMVPRVQEFLTEARRLGVPVIHVRTEYNPWTSSPPFLRRVKQLNVDVDKTLRPGSWGAQFYKVLPEEGECILTKHRWSAFAHTSLNLVLGCIGARSIVLTGMATAGCVEATARDGFMNDLFVVTLEDCTGDGSKERHEQALERLATYGVVTSSQVALEAWEKAGKAKSA